MENVGSGVKRILKSYDKDCFIFSPNFLTVSFKYANNDFKYEEYNANQVKIISTTTKKTDQVELNENQQIIIECIKENPKVTFAEIAENMAITASGVKYNVNKLKELGILTRIGDNYSGYWEVNEKNIAKTISTTVPTTILSTVSSTQNEAKNEANKN